MWCVYWYRTEVHCHRQWQEPEKVEDRKRERRAEETLWLSGAILMLLFSLNCSVSLLLKQRGQAKAKADAVCLYGLNVANQLPLLFAAALSKLLKLKLAANRTGNKRTLCTLLLYSLFIHWRLPILFCCLPSTACQSIATNCAHFNYHSAMHWSNSPDDADAAVVCLCPAVAQ